jgi:Ribonuclease G/E
MPMKDVGLRIRVQRDLREQFLDACRVQDKPASQVLREFMREYTTKHGKEAASPSRKKGPTT